MENAFEILVSRYRLLLGTIEQRQQVVRDIVLTCVAQYAGDTQRPSSQYTNCTG